MKHINGMIIAEAIVYGCIAIFAIFAIAFFIRG